jgi:hypothetical protein
LSVEGDLLIAMTSAARTFFGLAAGAGGGVQLPLQSMRRRNSANPH